MNKQKNTITDKEMEAVTKQVAYLATLNALPKIHKSELIKNATTIQSLNGNADTIVCSRPRDLTFRPILSCQECPTKNLADLDKLLRPFAMKVKHRLKDTWHFLKKLPESTFVDGIGVTADVSSLYTNITTESGAKAIEHYIDMYPECLLRRFSKQFVIEIFSLKQSLFQF